MSVQFRQRTPGEYARIVWKRKWLILLPMIAIASAITWVVLRLPDVYESSTLIVVTPPTIPSTIVPTASEDTLTRQLNSIGQFVTSRSSLQPLVEKYRLYEAERLRNEPMESIIDQVRKDIKVEVNTSRNDITNGFNITFRGRDPRTTQAVAGELASKYIDAQTKAGTNDARSVEEFFAQKVARDKEELDAIDQRRLDFMMKNLANLPMSGDSLGIQLTGLFEQQKSYVTDIGRLRDQVNTLSQQLADMKKQRQQAIDNIIEEGNDPKKAPEYVQLTQREADLEAELRNMLTTLKPANPDVKKKQEELDSVRVKMERVVEQGKAKAEEKRKRYESQIDPALNNVGYNLEYAKSEIARQQKLLDETNASIASVRERINAVPEAQVGLENLDREYKAKQEAYNSLLEQQRKGNMISEISTSRQGISIRVVDPANLPERPVAPKRPLLIIMGLMLGLFIGLALAAIFEVPRLLTIQTTNDAEHYTGLPVLVAVPELMTPQEARQVPRRRMLLIAAGIIITLVSIPLLAYALRFTHILDKFVT